MVSFLSAQTAPLLFAPPAPTGDGPDVWSSNAKASAADPPRRPDRPHRRCAVRFAIAIAYHDQPHTEVQSSTVPSDHWQLKLIMSTTAMPSAGCGEYQLIDTT